MENICQSCPRRARRFISLGLVKAVKDFPKKQGELAKEAGINQNQLSRILSGAELVKVDDPRIVRLAKLINFEGELWSTELVESKNMTINQ